MLTNLANISFPGFADKRRENSAVDAPRIAIIGCGAIAELFYLPAIAKHPAILERLILVDRNEGRAQAVASAFDVRDYLCDYHEILNEVDAAIVAVPHHLHHSVSMDFLVKGVHVLCEKPLAVTTVEAREMVAQAQESGVTLCVNNTRRLFPSFLKVKELLSTGAIGRPLSIKYFQGREFTWQAASEFRFNSKTSRTGVLIDEGAHVLDAICWWLGEKPKLICCENDSFGGIEAVTVVKFEHNQCFGEIKLSWLSKLQNRYIITGELGVIEGGVKDWRVVNVTSKPGAKKRMKLKCKEKNAHEFANRLVDNFLDVVGEGQKPLIPASDVIASIEWIEECYRAATRFSMPWYEALEVPDGK